MRTFRRLGATVAALAALSALTACASTGAASEPTATRQVTDSRGTVTVPGDPQRAYVADWAALDTLAVLDVPVAGASLTRMPAALTSAFPGAVDIGAPKEVDLEKLAAGDPDLIVIGARAASQYDKLSALAPTVDITAETTSHFDALSHQATILGETFGKQKQVADELAAIDTLVEQTRAETAGKGSGLVLMVSGGKVSAFGPGSRFGLIHDDLGVAAAAPDLKQDAHGQAVSFEFIAQADPEWIFVIDRDKAVGTDASPALQVLDNPLVNNTRAAKNGRVVELDGIDWYVIGNGLGTTRTMVTDVREALAKS